MVVVWDSLSAWGHRMQIDRRHLLAAGAGALAFPGVARAAAVCDANPSNNLIDRIRSAARHAYLIGPDATLTGLGAECGPPVGYVGPIAAAITGDADIDAAFVAASSDGVIISVRGTLAPTRIASDPIGVIRDWGNDTGIKLAADKGQPALFPGKFHTGFAQSFGTIWAHLGDAIGDTVAANPGKPIYVTGHSKGGGVCPLLAWRLVQRHGKTNPVIVRTFAAPRCADEVFKRAYEDARIDHIRFEYDDDLVPHLPLQTSSIARFPLLKPLAAGVHNLDAGYADLGRLRFIQKDGEIIDDRPGLFEQRLTSLVKRINFDRARVGACHGFTNSADGYVSAHYTDADGAISLPT